MITIVPMQERHLDAIAALEFACFSDPWSRRSVASELENEWSLWLVAEEENAVAGYVGSQLVPPEADVMNLAVAPEKRRTGVAQRLLDALFLELRVRGITSLALEVRASNLPAQKLYEKNGFVQVGRRKNYYVNPREDALILRKEL